MNLAALEYRTMACDSNEEAIRVERALKQSQKHLFQD